VKSNKAKEAEEVLATKVCPICGSVSVAPEFELTDETVYYCCCCGTHIVGDKDIREK
jgi:transcription initiation factor TFIIIB Brf1 subunit/transcription initiation factor TFIIB